MRMSYKKALNLLIFVVSCFIVNGQPSSGDVFREYSWRMPEIEGNEHFLRVGGKFDYRLQNPKFPENSFKENGQIFIPHDVILKNVLKAEIMIEKMLCHDYTKGLQLSLNGNPPLIVPEAENIPEPQYAYMHHIYPLVEIPLEYLNKGKNNYFSLEVDSVQPWNWPQNLIYGLVLRIFYDLETVNNPTIDLFQDDLSLSTHQKIGLSIDDSKMIKKVDYIGYYEGINMEGDGVYTQWHYNWFKGHMTNHIGSTYKSPFVVIWNTEWIPDQEKPLQLAARVHYADGLIYLTESLKGLKIERKHNIELCKPYDQPKLWLTRNGDHECKMNITGDPKNAMEARLVWKSWSPGYMNGLYINNILVFIREGNKYAYHEHNVPLNDLTFIHSGENTIKTGKTPLYHGQMVHGTEIQWPGIMLLIKYE